MLVGLILALAVGRVGYDVLVRQNLKETAALFIGLPAILAVTFALTPRAKSATGSILKGMTIVLLLSTLFLGEGLVCVLFAAPLFYLIGILIGLALDSEKRRRGRASTGTYCLLIVMVLPFSLEGTSDALSFPRVEAVTAERVLMARPVDVEQALSRAPRFDRALPLALRVGFPTPAGSAGTGLAPRDRRVTTFTGGTEAAAVVLEVAGREPGSVRFRAIADRTPVAGWLQWQEAEVRWTPLDADRTRVQWTLRYRRRLDPAWYFAPLERAVVRAAAGYLIDAAATPRPEP